MSRMEFTEAVDISLAKLCINPSLVTLRLFTGLSTDPVKEKLVYIYIGI